MTAISAELLGALRRHPLWAAASDGTLRGLAAAAREVRGGPGTVLLQAGAAATSVFLLLEGAVRVLLPGPSRGRQITAKLFRAPAIFGEAESSHGVPWGETVEALTSVRVLEVPIAAYLSLLEREPKIAVLHYRELGCRFAISIRMAQAVGFAELSERVMALLASYGHQFGRRVPAGVLIDFELSQEALALEVGSNRRSVARVINHLYSRGLLRRTGRRYVIPDIEALVHAAPAAPVIAYSLRGR